MAVVAPAVAVDVAALGLSILLRELPPRIAGLYTACPARALRTLLLNRRLEREARDRAIALALRYPQDVDLAELILA